MLHVAFGSDNNKRSVVIKDMSSGVGCVNGPIWAQFELSLQAIGHEYCMMARESFGNLKSLDETRPRQRIGVLYMLTGHIMAEYVLPS